MDFSKSTKAYLTSFPLRKMSGQQKFLALAAYCASGSLDVEIEVTVIREKWPKAMFGFEYHATFYARADEAGWVKPVRTGFLSVTQDGLEHLSALTEAEITTASRTVSGIQVFGIKQTHSFDKFLRGVFAQAKKSVFIADSYVDDTIFDNVLDVVPSSTVIKLIYNRKQGAYDARVKRFKTQYANFETKRYAALHDRFFIVDGTGYMIGPSIKDAARKSPALVVSLSASDSKKLLNFFQTIFSRSR